MTRLKNSLMSLKKKVIQLSALCILFCLIPVPGLAQDISTLTGPYMVFFAEEDLRGYLRAMHLDTYNRLKSPQNLPEETPMMDRYLEDLVRRERVVAFTKGGPRIKVLGRYKWSERFPAGYYQVILIDSPEQLKCWLLPFTPLGK